MILFRKKWDNFCYNRTFEHSITRRTSLFFFFCCKYVHRNRCLTIHNYVHTHTYIHTDTKWVIKYISSSSSMMPLLIKYIVVAEWKTHSEFGSSFICVCVCVCDNINILYLFKFFLLPYFVLHMYLLNMME